MIERENGFDVAGFSPTEKPHSKRYAKIGAIFITAGMALLGLSAFTPISWLGQPNVCGSDGTMRKADTTNQKLPKHLPIGLSRRIIQFRLFDGLDIGALT